MPLLKEISRKKKPRRNATTPAIAHIVSPAATFAKAEPGTKFTAVCGFTFAKDGDLPADAPVCRSCFMEQLKADDKRVEAEAAEAKTAAQARTKAESDRALANGEAEGRAKHANELRTLAQAEAAKARAEATAPRYEDLGKALKLKLVEGGETTVRKNRVASVQLIQSGPNHAVLVDGNAVHVGPDQTLAKHHFDDIHRAVFGS